MGLCPTRGNQNHTGDSVSHGRVQGIVFPAGPVSSLASLAREFTPVGDAVPVVRAVSARVTLACGFSRGRLLGKSVKSTSLPDCPYRVSGPGDTLLRSDSRFPPLGEHQTVF